MQKMKLKRMEHTKVSLFADNVNIISVMQESEKF